MAKRKETAKQKAALAKGRAALMAKLGGKGEKEPKGKKDSPREERTESAAERRREKRMGKR